MSRDVPIGGEARRGVPLLLSRFAALAPPLRRRWYRLRHFAALRRLRRGEADGYSLRSFDELACIFVHVPRTGGVSVATALFGHLAGGHRTAEEYLAIFGPETFDRYFKFAFVRHPETRLASAFGFLKQGGLTERDRRWSARYLADCPDLEHFCLHRLGDRRISNWVHFRPQWEFVCDRSGRLQVDFLGRFERLQADFATVAERVARDVTLPHRNRSRHGTSPRPITLSRHARLVIKEIYRRDFELLGYRDES